MQVDRLMDGQSMRIFLKSFLLIFILFALEDVCLAQNELKLDFSPNETEIGSTTKFVLKLLTNQDLHLTKIDFFVDAKEIGAKELAKIGRNNQTQVAFDYKFDDESYLGEHYIEIKLTSYAQNNTEFSKSFYRTIILSAPKSKYNIILLIDGIFLVLLIFINLIYNYLRRLSILELDAENRKFMLNLIVTVLPIVTSYFISIINNTFLRLEIFSIIVFLLHHTLLHFYHLFFIKAQIRPHLAKS
jgi:hypothetical protein